MKRTCSICKESWKNCSQGVVNALVKGNVAAIVEVNSETDLLSAKNEKFRTFVNDVLEQIITSESAYVEAETGKVD